MEQPYRALATQPVAHHFVHLFGHLWTYKKGPGSIGARSFGIPLGPKDRLCDEHAAEDEGNDGHQLNQDVK